MVKTTHKLFYSLAMCVNRYPSSDADQKCMYFMVSETSHSVRCKLLIEIIIPFARVLKKGLDHLLHY